MLLLEKKPGWLIALVLLLHASLPCTVVLSQVEISAVAKPVMLPASRSGSQSPVRMANVGPSVKAAVIQSYFSDPNFADT